MDKKKILIVCKSFYPEITPRAFRATELAIQFSKLGHKVTVITAQQKFDYINFESLHENINIILMNKNPLVDFTIRRSKLLFYLTRSFTKALEILIDFPNIGYYWLVPNKLKKFSGYDLLISIAYPHSIHWGVGRLYSSNNKPASIWVADSGDPFMGSSLDFKKPFYFKYLEKYTFRKADYLTVPFSGAIKAYYPEFNQKIKVIPQGYTFPDLTTTSSQINTVPTFLYAGLFIPGQRDPRKFMDLILSLNIPFKFIIYTKQTQFIKEYISRSKGMIEVNDYIPRINLFNVMNSMDFLVNFDNNIGEMLPSKLIDYAYTKKPILNITKEFDVNIVIEFMNGNYKNKFAVKNIEKYKIENVAHQFLNLVD